MEKSLRSCPNCHQSFTPHHNPKQQYCGQGICQNARKRDWRKQKHAHDSDYRQNQRRAEQRWQQRHPDYWKKYRASHPDYSKRNREQQRIRQRQWRLKRAQKLSKKKASKFANSDALHEAKLPQDAVKSGLYRMIPVTHTEFANSDALLVTIAVVTGT